MDLLLADNFLKKKESVPADTVKKAQLIGLYFSAHWCPPCRGFTPILKDFYNEVNSTEKKIEIVFLSSDNSLESFNEYYGTMPWLSAPYGDKRTAELKAKYGVTGIPTLIVLQKDGEPITYKGRMDVQTKGVSAIDAWLALSK